MQQGSTWVDIWIQCPNRIIQVLYNHYWTNFCPNIQQENWEQHWRDSRIHSKLGRLDISEDPGRPDSLWILHWDPNGRTSQEIREDSSSNDGMGLQCRLRIELFEEIPLEDEFNQCAFHIIQIIPGGIDERHRIERRSNRIDHSKNGWL